ncbi:hypothetical protein Moror_5806 [Moniliophthora roreri MCA 2997]|uniref:Uncharacterized protein n=1 Tax=Moniliophthora roreri (strain MCA 2997) TaxID=1381753 RepID=V2X393_MONRO|nr:hypothetical protein Moror_5806 [Moniliophthora roreri MCA 2997]
MNPQARIPAALAALHNFIMNNDTKNYIPDLCADRDAENPFPGVHINANKVPTVHPQSELASSHVTEQEYEEALEQWDDIAEAMWVQYQEVLQSCADKVDQYLKGENILDGEVDGGVE